MKGIPEKDDNGKPRTKPRNPVTNPTSKVDHDVMRYPKYINDPYERKDQFESQ